MNLHDAFVTAISRRIAKFPADVLAAFAEMRKRAPNTWACTSDYATLMKLHLADMPFDPTDLRVIQALTNCLGNRPGGRA
jgi:hypothetical protein